MSGFFEELQRRKVYRVAAAYIIAAGFIIQIGSAVFPAWELPNWTLRLVVVFLLIGFPIALILAWAYDVTPQGIRATPAPTTHRRRNIYLLVAAGIIVSSVAGFFLLPRASARKVDKSIAVLPFENLSDEKDNAYFADGMQDDILTNLSKIGDLKVISRTSVNSYRDNAGRNAREIGKALGVATLLEGSVRRVGNRVRVNVQLINADNDEHIWAEDYDRDLTDVFAIQSDLAQKIATSLQAKLSPNEKTRLNQRPTENSEAYLLFMQAEPYANGPEMFTENYLKAEQLYGQAIKLDPNFAAAHACLSMVESWAYHTFDPTPPRREKARASADDALRLQPDLPEGHLALGFAYYYGNRDYDRALAEFEIARRDLPNEAQAYMAIGAIQRRQGKWTESIANFEKALALDPKNAGFLYNLGFTYVGLKQYEAADKMFDRALEVAPQSFSSRALKGITAILWKGDVEAAEKQLALTPVRDANGLVTSTEVWVLMLGRKFSEALREIEQFRGEVCDAHGGRTPKAFFEGLIYLCQGDKTKAMNALEHARAIAEQLVQESPNDAPRRAILGQILAALGQKEAAIVEGKRATELLPESEDAYDGPQITGQLAAIYAWTGENDQALRLLDHLLQTTNGITVPLLKLDPSWDPLRKDPRFQALIDKYAANPDVALRKR
ncbi:MAG TPA: tetratricopeptide repeat protein [Candidatus Dormibacteraeota bacterium]|nr:tetratricopeptide repeat protein [Candidatus Dormibacteraeota bacterium]